MRCMINGKRFCIVIVNRTVDKMLDITVINSLLYIAAWNILGYIIVDLFCNLRQCQVKKGWNISAFRVSSTHDTTRQLTNVASDASNTSKGLWIWYAIFRNCMSYQTKTLGTEVYVQTQYIISTEYRAEIEIRMNGVKQTFVSYIPRKIYSQKGCI